MRKENERARKRQNYDAIINCSKFPKINEWPGMLAISDYRSR